MNKTFTSSRRRVIAAGAALCIAAVAGTASTNAPAQTTAFPAHAMRSGVPFPPGSETDATARVFASAIADITGKPAIVENKPGANGVVAVQAALGAPADGHTIFFGSNSTLTTNVALFRKLPYDPLNDFKPL